MSAELNELASNTVTHALDLAERIAPLVQLVRITLETAQRQHDDALIGLEALDRLTHEAASVDRRFQALVSALQSFEHRGEEDGSEASG